MSSAPSTDVSRSTVVDSRHHDLDALRAAAMLLGIVYHSSLAFALGTFWLVQDKTANTFWYVFESFVHGFRMPLFFLLSGFFTAMMWRKRGLASLLKNRAIRVMFPLLIGMITVIPATTVASIFAFGYTGWLRANAAHEVPATKDIWSAIRHDDSEALASFLKEEANLERMHPEYQITPLTWAALNNSARSATYLIDNGAKIATQNSDGGTALHAAAFMGADAVAQLLLEKGADPNAGNYSGETAMQSAATPIESVYFIAGLLSIEVNSDRVLAGRRRALELMEANGGLKGSQNVAAQQKGDFATAISQWLFKPDLLAHLWFLWILVLLIAIFALLSLPIARVPSSVWGSGFLISTWSLIWLIPLTCWPQAYMRTEFGQFGPDTSLGLFPLPHILAYYAIFFLFGVAYFEAQDSRSRWTRHWKILLPISLFVVFPLALEFTHGVFGLRASLMPQNWHRFASILFQSVFAWGMTLGCMGLFAAKLQRERYWVRYLSDASYWLYLWHLPLIIAAQAIMQAWDWPAWFKVSIQTIGTVALLLLSYQWFVRYSFIGRILNGKRVRPALRRESAA